MMFGMTAGLLCLVVVALFCMAISWVDLSVTASQVQPSGIGDCSVGIAAEAITAGQPVYKLAAGTIGLADNNVALKKTVAGIAVCDAASGQAVVYQHSDDSLLTIGAGASVTAGLICCLSDTAGGICPVADLAAGEDVIQLGVANASDQIKLHINNSGIAHA